MKRESLTTQKPSMRLPPQVKPGFFRAHSPCWSEIIIENWVPADLKPSTIVLPQLTRGFVIAQSPYWLGYRKRKLSSCRLRNHKWQCFPRWCLDSSAHTVPLDSKITTEKWVTHDSKSSLKLLPQLTLGFFNEHSPCWLPNRNHKLSRWRLRNQYRDCLHS